MKDKKACDAMGKSTRAIHLGGLENPIVGEVSVPIFQSSTFSFPSAEDGAARFSGEQTGYIYTRLGNPTINALEENVASMEAGYGGTATATGMAAISTLFLSTLNGGDHVVATDSLYGTTRVLLESELSQIGRAHV